MYDGIEFERKGIPAVVVSTDKFTKTARAMAEAQGFQGFPQTVIRHPIVIMEEEEMRQEAEKAVTQIINCLLSQGTGPREQG